MSESAIQVIAPDFREAIKATKLMMLLPAQKRRYLSRLGRMAIAQAKKNVKEQKTIDGSSMEPRKNGTGKMFPNLTKARWLGMKLVSEESALLHFFRNAGIVAYKHHHGGRAIGLKTRGINYPGTFDVAKIPQRLKQKRFDVRGQTGCSANHAAMLIRLQYLPPMILSGYPGGGIAGLEYVMQNVTRKQALFLIAKATARAGYTEIPDNTPARPVLGASREQQEKWGAAIMRDLHEKFRAKNYKTLLD